MGARNMISAKLPQELQIIFEKKAQIVDAIEQHCKALHAEAKGKTAIVLAVDSNVGKHIGVDHAAAQNLEPSAQAMCGREAYIDLGRRFSKWKIGGSKPNFEILALKKSPQELMKQALEVAHGRPVIN